MGVFVRSLGSTIVVIPPLAICKKDFAFLLDVIYEITQKIEGMVQKQCGETCIISTPALLFYTAQIEFTNWRVCSKMINRLWDGLTPGSYPSTPSELNDNSGPNNKVHQLRGSLGNAPLSQIRFRFQNEDLFHFTPLAILRIPHIFLTFPNC